MRVSAIPLIVAGAGLAFQAVGASPLRVVVVTSSTQMLSGPPPTTESNGAGALVNFRFGHAMMAGSAGAGESGGIPQRKHLCAKMRAKAQQMQDAIAEMFGFTAIGAAPSHAGHNGPGLVHILPIAPIPIPETMPVVEAHKASIATAVPSEKIEEPSRVVVHQSHHFGKHQRGSCTFLRRIHAALMKLGPWEGRAVAFVLGCGIGVLLRMLWVLTVLSVRALRSVGRADEPEEVRYALVFEQDDQAAEELPPHYIDEKIAPADVKA